MRFTVVFSEIHKSKTLFLPLASCVGRWWPPWGGLTTSVWASEWWSKASRSAAVRPRSWPWPPTPLFLMGLFALLPACPLLFPVLRTWLRPSLAVRHFLFGCYSGSGDCTDVPFSLSMCIIYNIGRLSRNWVVAIWLVSLFMQAASNCPDSTDQIHSPGCLWILTDLMLPVEHTSVLLVWSVWSLQGLCAAFSLCSCLERTPTPGRIQSKRSTAERSQEASGHRFVATSQNKLPQAWTSIITFIYAHWHNETL